jgi:hypothetical protein
MREEKREKQVYKHSRQSYGKRRVKVTDSSYQIQMRVWWLPAM